VIETVAPEKRSPGLSPGRGVYRGFIKVTDLILAYAGMEGAFHQKPARILSLFLAVSSLFLPFGAAIN
jgi:hypothetical protein